MQQEKDGDLSIFDTKTGADHGFDLVLLDPRGVPTRVVFTLFGFDSQVYQDALMEQRRQRFRELQKPRPREMTPEELDAVTVGLLAVATKGWSPNPLKLNGEVYEFNLEAAKRLYANPSLRPIREQVSEAIGDRTNVLGEPSTN